MSVTAPSEGPPLDGSPAAARHRAAVKASLCLGVLLTIAGLAGAFGPKPGTFEPLGTMLARAAPTVVALAIAFGLWWYDASRRAIGRALDAIRAPSDRARRIATVAIALGAAVYFYATKWWQGDELGPVWHDSNQHLVQAQLLLHGRLWLPPHPLADHLETFFVFVRPVYAALHFPGTSMLYVPFLALGLGPAVFGAAMTGATVGLMYRVVAELLDGVAAALVVPVICSLALVRELSTMLLSHHTFLVPVLLAFWAFLRWRRTPRGGSAWWLLAVGTFIAYAGIMRPVEALSYAVALGLGVAVTLGPARPVRWLTAALAIGVGAAPWMGVQLVFDRYVSGHWLLPPYEYYIRIFQPAVSYAGYQSAPRGEALPTLLMQKVDYYDKFILPLLRLYVSDGPLFAFLSFRLRVTLLKLASSPLLYVLWTPAVLGFTSLGLRLFAVAAVAFFALYVPHVFFLPHYPIALVPLGAILTVAGARVVGRAFVGGRRSAEVAVVLFVLAATVSTMPECNPMNRGAGLLWATSCIDANHRVPDEVEKPAVVLYRYRPPTLPYDPKLDGFHDEPVYTIDALRPEDSPVARLQDLGPKRNREAYAFFAARDPNRHFYLYDRRLHELVPLGTARELLERGEPPAYFRVATSRRDGSVATTQAAPESLDVKP